MSSIYIYIECQHLLGYPVPLYAAGEGIPSTDNDFVTGKKKTPKKNAYQELRAAASLAKTCQLVRYCVESSEAHPVLLILCFRAGAIWTRLCRWCE